MSFEGKMLQEFKRFILLKLERKQIQLEKLQKEINELKSIDLELHSFTSPTIESIQPKRVKNSLAI